jgi:uncharacterized membrane protein YciS (DUF1049 family)
MFSLLHLIIGCGGISFIFVGYLWFKRKIKIELEQQQLKETVKEASNAKKTIETIRITDGDTIRDRMREFTRKD